MKRAVPFILIAGLITGFFYRQYLASFAVSTLVGDMIDYDEYARALVSGKMAINCCTKNIGYSVLVAGIYYLFGNQNIGAIRITNIVLDLLTALIVYRIGKDVFGRGSAIISFLLYIANPFTSSYTGLLLAESLTLFLIAVLAYVISRPIFTKKPYLWLVTGILLGLLLFTRHAFYYYVFGFVILMVLVMFRKSVRIYFLGVVLVGFLIASSYTLVANYRTYGVVSLLPPYNLGPVAAYASFYLHEYPEITSGILDPEYRIAVGGYFNVPLEGKRAYIDTYRQKFREKMKTQWPLFLQNTLIHNVRLWDKDHLYVYEDPFYPRDAFYLQIINSSFLIFFSVGIVLYMRKRQTMNISLVLFTLSLFLYISTFIAMLSTETRHSLFFYPLLTLWAGYGAFRLMRYNTDDKTT